MSIVTLTTDFGLSDTYVAQMKGVIYSIAPKTKIVDLTHEIPPQNVLLGQMALQSAWRYFPKGTIHVVVVDPGVGGKRERLVVSAGGHFFVGPDNGLFSFTSEMKDASFWNLKWRNSSKTFEGRDIFAPVAARLANGMAPNRFGRRSATIRRIRVPVPNFRKARAVGRIIGVDHFGNLISNFTVKMLGHGATVFVGRRKIGPIRQTYSSAPVGNLIALWNSSNLLEIAVRNGSAKNRLCARIGQKILVHLEQNW